LWPIAAAVARPEHLDGIDEAIEPGVDRALARGRAPEAPRGELVTPSGLVFFFHTQLSALRVPLSGGSPRTNNPQIS